MRRAFLKATMHPVSRFQFWSHLNFQLRWKVTKRAQDSESQRLRQTEQIIGMDQIKQQCFILLLTTGISSGGRTALKYSEALLTAYHLGLLMNALPFPILNLEIPQPFDQHWNWVANHLASRTTLPRRPCTLCTSRSYVFGRGSFQRAREYGPRRIRAGQFGELFVGLGGASCLPDWAL